MGSHRVREAGKDFAAQRADFAVMALVKDLLRRNPTNDLSTLIFTELDGGEPLETVLLLKKNTVSWVELSL